MSVFKVGSNKSSQNNFPSVRPTLDLDFANSKTLDPRITFTRASGGSYYGADGLIKLAGVNEPRFDHNPTTGESLGLLVEEARTNLITYSEQFDNAAWSKSNATVIANQVVAPNGTLTGSLLYPTATSAYTYIQNGWGPINGYATLSVYAKSAGKNFLALWRPDFVGGNAWFNLSTGEVASVSSGTASIVSVGNGWYRCTYVSTIQSYYASLIISATDANGSLAVTASGTSGIYIWGGQGESSPSLGNFPTSYIPTEASTRTRAADTASITGKNFSSWYNSSEGSIMMNAKIQEVQNGTTKQVFIFEGNTSTQRILDVYTFSSNVTYRDFYVDNNGVNGISVSNFTANVFQKFARSYGENSMSAVTAGIVNGTTSTTIPTTIQQLGIFAGISYGTGFGTANGTISRLTYYPKRLPDAQLQVLTR